MILTTMIPFNIGDKTEILKEYSPNPFFGLDVGETDTSFREVLVIDVKITVKGNLQVLVEFSDLTRTWISISLFRSWRQLHDKV